METHVKQHWLAGKQPRVMAILNLTPDSFFDGGQYSDMDSALYRVEQMVKEGADIIDLGGESTRPGAQAPGFQQEMDRVLPVLEQIKKRFPIALSVDTSSPRLMQAAIELGIDLINDVRALQRLEGVDFLAKAHSDICLMHMQGEPDNMQKQPVYDDILATLRDFFEQRIRFCEQNGIVRSRLLIDPGFGFGKTLGHNLTLLNRIDEFQVLGCPVLVGTSRKSMIGMVLDKPVNERLYGSLSTLVLALSKGARVFRVHDVKPSRETLDMAWAVLNENGELRKTK